MLKIVKATNSRKIKKRKIVLDIEIKLFFTAIVRFALEYFCFTIEFVI